MKKVVIDKFGEIGGNRWGYCVQAKGDLLFWREHLNMDITVEILDNHYVIKKSGFFFGVEDLNNEKQADTRAYNLAKKRAKAHSNRYSMGLEDSVLQKIG